MGFLKALLMNHFVWILLASFHHKKEAEPLWVDIAAMTPGACKHTECSQNHSVLKLLEAVVSDKIKVETTQMPAFNKVWFYLIATVSVQEMHFLKS